MMSSQEPNRTRGDSGSAEPRRFERRKTLPTRELWDANIKALGEHGLHGCQIRYTLVEGVVTFMVRFQDEVPEGQFKLILPILVVTEIEAWDWKRFVLTVDIAEEGEIGVRIWGRTERGGVPLDVRLDLVRSAGKGMGISQDTITYTDARTEESFQSSMAEVLEAKLKDGTRKFCRKDDTVRDLSVEGVVAILGRFLRDASTRRRILPK